MYCKSLGENSLTAFKNSPHHPSAAKDLLRFPRIKTKSPTLFNFPSLVLVQCSPDVRKQAQAWGSGCVPYRFPGGADSVRSKWAQAGSLPVIRVSAGAPPPTQEEMKEERGRRGRGRNRSRHDSSEEGKATSRTEIAHRKFTVEDCKGIP